MTPERKKHIEMWVLFAIGVVILILLFLWWESSQAAAAPATTSTTTAPASTVDGQPVNLNFEAPTIDFPEFSYPEFGYVPLFGFLGYGAYY